MRRRLLECLCLVSASCFLGLIANLITRRLPLLTPYSPAPVVEIHLAAARPLLKNQLVCFVDLRVRPKGSIPGAIPMVAVESPKVLERLKQAPDVICYGEDSQDLNAREVARRLTQQGVPHVVFLVEGWRGWQDAGNPIVF